MLPVVGGSDPSPAQARELLRRELLDPRYAQDPLQRLLDWVGALVRRTLLAADGASGASTLVGLLLLLALAVGVLLVLSRARRSARVGRRPEAVLAEAGLDADALRARAERLLEQGHEDEALLESFRALARRAVEQGRLGEDPGATAREVATALADERVARAAEVFDAVLYGGHPASLEQVREILDLDLAAARR